jgi:hypothetical protein
MPRPNPPRKRPRNRPRGTQSAARTDAALNRQTAQSTQGKTPPDKPQRPAGGDVAAAAPYEPPPLWSRRSYAILVALVAVIELPVTAIQWAFQPAVSNGVSKAPLGEVLPFINPISLLIACLLAAPIAKTLSGETRALKFLETVTVGVVTFFIYLLLATGVGVLVAPAATTTTGPGACSGTTSGVATPLPASASARASSATPCPSPAPTEAPRASANATPQPTATPASGSAAGTVNAANIPGILAAFSVADVAAYVLTIYLYPPLYKRLRTRRPPPPPRQRKPAKK